MTRVLLDTNVVLDFLLDRAPFADAAAALWQANDDGRIEAYVSVITPVNVFYKGVSFPILSPAACLEQLLLN